MIECLRVGFSGVDTRATEAYDGPELALQAVLRRLEENNRVVISVSVLRSTRATERYEAFIVCDTRDEDQPRPETTEQRMAH